MLERGFLKSREKEENARTVKNSRMFLFVGVLVVLMGFVYMTTLSRQDSTHSSVMIAGMMMIVGIALVLISMWMNFFANNKKRGKM